MEDAPAFEEFEPASDCDCPGCVQRRRRARALPPSLGGHPAAHGARRALVVAAAASSVVGVGVGVGQSLPAVASSQVGGQVSGVGAHPARPAQPGDAVRADAAEPPAWRPGADGPDTPQGGTSALHGAPGESAAPRPVTRAEIITRAKVWVAAKVPYSMRKFWTDGYRQDCSGFVSMAWNLGGNEWTGSLGKYGIRISKDELEPGDILLFHNPANPERGSHVTLFGGWTDYTRTHYLAYEQARPHTRRQATPYAYWTDSDRYLAYRYKGLRPTGEPTPTEPAPSQSGSTEPAPTEPAPTEPGSPKPAPGETPTGESAPGPTGAPPFPGKAYFRPGQSNAHVTLLGRQLVRKGFGKYYAQGPGPRWGEADRRAVEAFQRAQGWRGGAADGMPGPETWRRLFA